MRKIFSYSCILLLLMNVMGYYGVFVGLTIRNNSLMDQRLDREDFDRSQVITLKLPLSVPYAPDAFEYQRVNGKFEHNGGVYRLLKQKLAKDTLTIICVKDADATNLNKALSGYTKTFSDHHAAGTTGKHVITLIKDFLPQAFAIASAKTGWQKDVVLNSTPVVFIATYESGIIHPPEGTIHFS